MRSFVLAMLLLLVAGPLLALPEPPVALVNPGFETADQAGQPQGWTKYVTFPGHAEWSLDRVRKHTGEASARLTLTGETRCAVSQYLKATLDGPQTLSCLLRGDPVGGLQAQLQLQWFAMTDWPRQIQMVSAEAPSPWVALTGEWTKLAATGVRPAQADLLLAVIIVRNTGQQPGVAWADEALLRPGAFPAPLVRNPGFELDLNGDGVPDDWGASVYGGGFDLKRETAMAHGGGASACLTGAANHGDRACFSQLTPVFSAPRKLRLSLWYRGRGLSLVLVQLLTPVGVQRPGGGIEYGNLSATPKLDNPLRPGDLQWQELVQEVEVPAEARQAGVMRCAILLYQKGEGTLWYDDVRLELVE